MISDKKFLTKKSEDLSKWYNEIIEKAGLVDQSPVKGCMVIMPYGYAIWESIQRTLDEWFKADGVQNAYFPLFIPYSLLQKEKKHVEGFSPELALVTIGGGETLHEPLVVRPTSETIMYQSFAKWISSYKDLPLKINQWCNVVRWEKRTYPFLRTTEFLWQEGHTVHANEKEAMEMVMRAINWYKDIFEKKMGISVYVGEKSESEKFAGAKRTFSVELVIPNGKALQGATSHNLGQNFAKSLDIHFLDNENKQILPFQTSWGLSTRAIGGLILSHGDDNGLVVAPNIAPIQVVIIGIVSKNEADMKDVTIHIKRAEEILKKSNIRYSIDKHLDKSIGYRLSETEIKGIPLRIEIGPAEVDKNAVIISRRDTFKKEAVSLNKLSTFIEESLDSMQKILLRQSKEQKEDLTINVNTFQEFEGVMKNRRSFIRAYWCESATCESKIKELTKATTRVCELEEMDKNDNGFCIYCKNKARRKWLFAQAY